MLAPWLGGPSGATPHPQMGWVYLTDRKTRRKLGANSHGRVELVTLMMAAAAAGLRGRRSRQISSHTNASTLMEEEFRAHYHLSKTTLRWLYSHLASKPRLRWFGSGFRSMTIEEQVLCALRFYATGSFQ